MSLDTLLPRLENNDEPLKATELINLSRLQGPDLERFLETWRRTSIQRRRNVIDQLADLAEDEVDVDFNRIFLTGLFDADVQVRADSIKALWEYEDENLIEVLLRLLHDPEAMVRADEVHERVGPPERRVDAGPVRGGHRVDDVRVGRAEP